MSSLFRAFFIYFYGGAHWLLCKTRREWCLQNILVRLPLLLLTWVLPFVIMYTKGGVMIKHKRGKTGEVNVHISIKMPVGLRGRIDTLAQKGLITRNKWIVKALTREARYSGSVSEG